MSTSTVFKQAPTEAPAPEVLPSGKESPEQGVVDVEVPYLDYEASKGKPYLAEYFGLGDRWNDREGGYPEEIAKIESYIKGKIESGETANSVKAVKDILKAMEKTNNLTKEERSVVKIEILRNYVDFMTKNGELMSNLKRYGNRI